MREENNKLDILLKCIGFEWDENNSNKIWTKHHVSPSECEQAFLNIPLIIFDDTKHSFSEKRYYALGATDGKKYLFIVCTIRNQKIRVISARDMNRKERKEYELHKENTKI
jgi:uncharacterized DUF497 family protein